ncbi:hydantoinase B/oxoprolinase family protein [Bosea sp. BK604]|uniref:hydantoinase B/oxoprolinase family protein n=1 Tax=Bosea sp. BK604 TaxID=2512180 RepID=UPI001045DCEA|nr:hydantoinase B/oxoprolinase family protein [Bosea sp. BK604]TCR65309.1 N-methylhydantoinase B [Bosea sp. BK604]
MDPIRTAMMNNRFTAIVEEASATLYRTAFTTYVKLAQDFQCALATPEGELFSHPEQSGVNIFMGLPLHSTLDFIGRETMQPGDVYITNDPFTTNGMVTHLMDVTMLRPVFHEGKLIAVGWTFIHASDIGGGVPGSISPSFTEVFQEGVRVRPMRLCRNDEIVPEVRDIFLYNSRIPDDMWGDFKAMLSALKGMERRLVELCKRYGAEQVSSGMRDVLDFAEAKARTVIAAIPDGTYSFSDYVELLKPGHYAHIMTTLRIEGDGIEVDFTGSDPQVPAAYNYTTGDRTHPYLVQALLNFILTQQPDTPRNGGLLRPIKTIAPRGTIVNAELPAAGGARVASSARVFDSIMACLNQAVPGGVLASGPGQIGIMALSAPHPRTGKTTVGVVNPLIGGSGGRATCDGVNAVDPRFGQVKSVPTELIEADTVLRVRRFALVPDSQSPGERQGGAALMIELENTGFEALTTVRGMNRFHFRPWGFKGGAHGRLGQAILNPGRADERNLGKIDVLKLAAGDVLRITTSAGGGFGDPLDRALDAIARDLRSGLVTAAHAERVYGLVFGADGTIDADATAARRAVLRKAAPELFDYGPEKEAYNRIWPAQMRSSLAIKVLAQKPALRQNLLVLVEQALTRRGATVDETSLDAALAEALDELSGRARRREPAPRMAAQ